MDHCPVCKAILKFSNVPNYGYDCSNCKKHWTMKEIVRCQVCMEFKLINTTCCPGSREFSTHKCLTCNSPTYKFLRCFACRHPEKKKKKLIVVDKSKEKKS